MSDRIRCYPPTDVKVGDKVKCNPFADLDARYSRNEEGDGISNIPAFEGEREVLEIAYDHWITVRRTIGTTMYPRQCVLVKGVDYE
jgi:hypothetical protein